MIHRVTVQDGAACERTQPGVAGCAHRHGGLPVLGEHHLAAFRGWVTERLR